MEEMNALLARRSDLSTIFHQFGTALLLLFRMWLIFNLRTEILLLKQQICLDMDENEVFLRENYFPSEGKQLQRSPRRAKM